MPRRRLTDEARQHLRLFEAETGVSARDCVIDEEHDRILLLVRPEDMAEAIGPGGETVRSVESQINTEIKLVADAETPADFVANALAPAAVYEVTIDDDDEETIAKAAVDEQDIGVAIGTEGRNIEAAKQLAARHFGINDIRIAGVSKD